METKDQFLNLLQLKYQKLAQRSADDYEGFLYYKILNILKASEDRTKAVHTFAPLLTSMGPIAQVILQKVQADLEATAFWYCERCTLPTPLADVLQLKLPHVDQPTLYGLCEDCMETILKEFHKIPVAAREEWFTNLRRIWHEQQEEGHLS